MLASFRQDWRRYKGVPWKNRYFIQVIKSRTLRYILLGRMSVALRTSFGRRLLRGVSKIAGNSMGNEIGFTHIGEGLVLLHPFGITVNPDAKSGVNVTLFKGSTIGSVRSGKNVGVPIIGDRVTVCCNAMVCGNIKIGNDVLIAAGAFVNFDVPDNSLVIGNPGVIYPKENASADYLWGI